MEGKGGGGEEKKRKGGGKKKKRSKVWFRVLNIFCTPFPWVGLRVSKGSPVNVAWI